MSLQATLSEEQKRIAAVTLQSRELKRQNAIRLASVNNNRKPRLYWNAAEDESIIAVLTPSGLELANEATRVFRWEYKRGIIYPSPETFVFVTERGGEIIRCRAGRHARLKKVTGTWREFVTFVRNYGIEIILEKEIFVPFVDQRHMKYAEQQNIIRDSAGVDLYKKLVVPQFRDCGYTYTDLLGL